MHLKQITDFGQNKTHIAANRASVISQALCKSHARFTCKLEDTSRNVPKALISGGSNNRKLFICSLKEDLICNVVFHYYNTRVCLWALSFKIPYQKYPSQYIGNNLKCTSIPDSRWPDFYGGSRCLV